MEDELTTAVVATRTQLDEARGELKQQVERALASNAEAVRLKSEVDALEAEHRALTTKLEVVRRSYDVNTLNYPEVWAAGLGLSLLVVGALGIALLLGLGYVLR